MKLKNVEAAGSKMAVRGLQLEVDKDGVVEIADENVCKILIQSGWSAISKPAPAPKKEEPKKEEPKKEEPKKEAPAPKKFVSKSKAKSSKPKYRRGE